jgi:ATP-dependent RNA helicase RhlE
MLDFSQYDLDPRILRGVQAAGYVSPTPIQLAALPLALEGRDLIGTAQTGTGKTAAFVLPLLQKLLGSPRGRTRALIVTPTRELAEQIHVAIGLLGRETGLKSATVYGGVGMGPQEQALRRGVDIVVACPGRLLDHIDRGNARLDAVEVLVLDEGDQMFDMGFLPAVRRIVGQVPARRQTMLFSATFPAEVERLAASVLTRPERIMVDPVRAATTVSHTLYPVAQHLKVNLLAALLPKLGDGSVLVFARTRHRADRVARLLKRDGHAVAPLHGDRSQSQRQKALDGFRDGRVQILVATDLAGRGLDIDGISHVINMDIPATVEAYIHRIGRTGRAERTGDAFTFVTSEDDDMVRAIERAVGGRIPRETLAGFDYDVPAPDRPPAPPRGQRNGAGSTNRAPGTRRGAPASVPVPAPRPVTATVAAPASGTERSRGANDSAKPVGRRRRGGRARRPWGGGTGG